VWYLFRPSHPLWFGHPNNIWWRAQIMKLLIMQFSPASCYFLLGQHILFRTLFLYILIFTFLDSRWEHKGFWTEW
jgi:hypothetical protein